MLQNFCLPKKSNLPPNPILEHQQQHQQLAVNTQYLSSPTLTRKQSQLLSKALKIKFSKYMGCASTLARSPSLSFRSRDIKKTHKPTLMVPDLPKLYSITDLLSKQIYEIYKEKHPQQCILFYMQIITLASKLEYELSGLHLDKIHSIIIDCFIFVANSLVEVGIDRLSFYFCVKGIRFCEIYLRHKDIGEFLLLIGNISKKIQRHDESIIFYKKALEYLWRHRDMATNELEMLVYSNLSQTLLQTNKAEQSRIFAEKYEIGYLEKPTSKTIQLSHELVDSVLNRKSQYHAITRQAMTLLLGIDLQYYVQTHEKMLLKGDEKTILESMMFNFEFEFESFMHDDMFFYQIPLPLDIESLGVKTISRRRSFDNFKFHVRNRSHTDNKNNKVLKIQNEKPKQFIIFNYRGGSGISRERLNEYFNGLVNKIRNKSD